MSISDTTTRLIDAQRERLKAEREAELLLSRVKLLQQEEARLKKQSEDQLKEQQRLEEIKRRNDQRSHEKARVQAERNRKVQEARQVIELLKARHGREKGRMQDAVWKIRQDSGREGREMRTLSMQSRKNHLETSRMENLKKSEAVRRDKFSNARRLESRRNEQQDVFHEDYLRRISDEESRLSRARQTMSELESMEARLIEKLKDSVDKNARLTGRTFVLERSSPNA